MRHYHKLTARRAGSILFHGIDFGSDISPWSPTYSAAKAGVIGLARGLAKRYGRHDQDSLTLLDGLRPHLARAGLLAARLYTLEPYLYRHPVWNDGAHELMRPAAEDWPTIASRGSPVVGTEPR